MKNRVACDGCGCVVIKTKQYASARFCQACWWSRVPDMKGSNPQARIEELEAIVIEGQGVGALPMDAPRSHVALLGLRAHKLESDVQRWTNNAAGYAKRIEALEAMLERTAEALASDCHLFMSVSELDANRELANEARTLLEADK
jgi:hypothetical protein